MPRKPLIHTGLKLDTYSSILRCYQIHPVSTVGRDIRMVVVDWYTLVVVVIVYHRSTTSSWDGIEVNRVFRTSAECFYDLWKKYHFSFASI